MSGGFTDATSAFRALDVAARSWLAGATASAGRHDCGHWQSWSPPCAPTVLTGLPFRPTLTRWHPNNGVRHPVRARSGGSCVSGSAGRSRHSRCYRLDSADVTNTDGTSDLTTITGFPSPAWDGSFDLWPLWVALVFFALAAAFRYGESLQRDTDGLV